MMAMAWIYSILILLHMNTFHTHTHTQSQHVKMQKFKYPTPTQIYSADKLIKLYNVEKLQTEYYTLKLDNGSLTTDEKKCFIT